METSLDTAIAPVTLAQRTFLPQAPLSIAHLILLTAGVGVATQVNSFDWNGASWRTGMQCAEIAVEGLAISITGLGLIRLARRVIWPSAPRYQTLPGQMLAYLCVVILLVKLASEWAIPWLSAATWSDFMINAQREMGLLFVIQLLELPAIAWFRYRVRGSLGWHLVALALLVPNFAQLLILGLSAWYHASGNPVALNVVGGLGNPISHIIQWSIVAAALAFALCYERFSRNSKTDWLHTVSAVTFFLYVCLGIFLFALEAMA